MTMRQVGILMTVVLLAFAGGCNQKQEAGNNAAPEASPRAEAAQASHDMTPEELGELGAQIRKAPDRADALLSQHGLTKESFEAQIRKITESPDASKRYAEAYRKASA
jgi:hypothetical protein